eukprot:scaffold1428_cov259-Pinguiococcus_pyrenoidosus.AAC.16
MFHVDFFLPPASPLPLGRLVGKPRALALLPMVLDETEVQMQLRSRAEEQPAAPAGHSIVHGLWGNGCWQGPRGPAAFQGHTKVDWRDSRRKTVTWREFLALLAASLADLTCGRTSRRRKGMNAASGSFFNTSCDLLGIRGSVPRSRLPRGHPDREGRVLHQSYQTDVLLMKK